MDLNKKFVCFTSKSEETEIGIHKLIYLPTIDLIKYKTDIFRYNLSFDSV